MGIFLLFLLTLIFFFEQMMNKVFGGTVHKKSVREDGVFNISVDNTCSLFRYYIFRWIRTVVINLKLILLFFTIGDSIIHKQN